MAALDQDLWADPSSLIADGIDPDLAVLSVINASGLLWALSGRRIHTAGTKRDTLELVPGGNTTFRLTDRPVTGVTGVVFLDLWTAESYTLSGVPASAEGIPADYIVIGNKVVVRTGPVVAPSTLVLPTHRNVLIQATYTVGANLPVGTNRVVLKLAKEFALDATDGRSTLPERITSITRQGITWTVLDPADFLDKGRTGVIFVDTWLMALNPMRTRQKARVIDPRSPRLVASEWVSTQGAAVWSFTNADTTTTFMGHGAPSAALLAQAQAGDSYINLDTGDSYSLTQV